MGMFTIFLINKLMITRLRIHVFVSNSGYCGRFIVLTFVSQLYKIIYASVNAQKSICDMIFSCGWQVKNKYLRDFKFYE